MYTLLPKYLDKEKDADAYQAVEELNIALNEAQKEGIRNIALTGPYGAGKSSVLKTLIRDYHDGREYLSISLATLKSEDDNTTEDTKDNSIDKEELNRKIEYSILQQLIYREKASDVPSSRFKRIPHFTKNELTKYALLTVGFILCFFIAFEPSFLRTDSFYEWLNFGKWNVLFDLSAVGYMIFCLISTVKFFIQSYSNSKLNKLNLKDGEIDIKEDTSIFNKHLDEILYFFRATTYNIIIIEDLDRFETSEIYLKLRELNQLINESKEINRHIVFIYAVKDDVFVNEARTKFFDQIITVIPVINPSNSKDILKQQLKDAGIDERDIADSDLRAIAFFILDMRILTNIVHEFNSYRNKLAKTGQILDLTKLLAMMVYKNYYPKDFSALHRRGGLVYNCIILKKKFLEIASKQLMQQKDEVKKQKNEAIKERLMRTNEVRLIFIQSLDSEWTYKCIDKIRLGNTYYSPNAIANSEEFFNKFLSLKEITYTYYYYYSNTTSTTLSLDISKRYEESGFKHRIDLINSEYTRKANVKIKEIEIKLRQLTSCSLSILLHYEDVRSSVEFTSLNLPELIEVFLIEGYLDEDYYDYISYFYEGMLSPSDRGYLMGIKRLLPPVYSQHIDKVENFVKELNESNFTTDSILNVELVEYLISTLDNSELSEKYFAYIKDLLLKEGVNYKFLVIYYRESKCPKAFFSIFLDERETSMWKEIQTLPSDKKSDLIECMLRFSYKLTTDMIEWCGENYIYLREHKLTIEPERMREIINESIFSTIDAEDEALLDDVIKAGSFVPNKQTLPVVLNYIYNTKDITCENLALDIVLNCQNEEVKNNLLSEDLFELTFDALPQTNKTESLDSIEKVLTSNLPESKKRTFLYGQEVKRENSEGLTEDQAKLLYDSNLIVASWSNADKLYTLDSIDQHLFITFIKKNSEVLSVQSGAHGLSNEVAIFESLFGDNDTLSTEEYENLIIAFSCEFDGDACISNLSKKRFDILIKSGAIPWKEENLRILKSSTNYIAYLIHHHLEFIKYIEDWDFEFSVSIIRTLINSDVFSLQEKLAIIEKGGMALILSNAGYASDAADIISKLSCETSFSVEELRSIIKVSSNLSANIRLANKVLSEMDFQVDEFEEVIKSLGREEFILLSERKRKPKFPNQPVIEDFLTILRQKGFISSFRKEDDFIRPHYYRES